MTRKLKKLISGLAILLKSPSNINILLNENSNWRKNFITRYSDYHKGLPLIDILDVVDCEAFILNYYSFLDGGSSPMDYILLKGLAKNINNCKYFEIGTWRAESTVNVAETAKECTSLTLGDEDLRRLGCTDNTIAQIGIYAKEKQNIQIIRGNSLTFKFNELKREYDLVFIDGDHHYESIVSDTKNVFNHLINDQSIVVWHDYTYSPDKIRWEVFKAILDGIPTNKRKYLYHVRNTNCAIYFPKRTKNRKIKIS